MMRAHGRIGAWTLAALVAAPLALAARQAPAPQAGTPDPWIRYVGTWRADPKAIEGQPRAPYSLRIAVEPPDLVMEWHSMAGAETRRLPLDGTPVATTVAGRPVTMSVALEEGALVVREVPGAASPPAAAVTYTVSRNRLLIDHAQAAGAVADEDGRAVFTKVPANLLEHGGTGAKGPTGKRPPG